MKNKLSIIVSSILLTSTICAKDINIINGWQIKGSDSGFSNMNSFNKNCIDTVWAYDTASNSWQAYSPKNATQNLINNSSIISLSNLKESDGFWVKGNSDCVVENNSTNANTQKNISLSIDESFISLNKNYKVITSKEIKDISNNIDIEDSKDIFIADDENNIKAFITSDFTEVNAKNSAISLFMLSIPSHIDNRNNFIESFKVAYSSEIDELATVIKNSTTLNDKEVTDKLQSLVYKIQNNSTTNNKVLKSLLTSNANWLGNTENSHIPIKVIGVKDINETTEQVTLEIFNKYSHWRELYVTDKNGNKIDTTSNPIAPNSTDKFLSTISTINGVATFIADILKGAFDDSFSLASEGTLNSTRTTVVLMLPKDAKNIVITPHSDIAKAFNMYQYVMNIIDISGLELNLLDYFRDISSRSEDIKELILLWDADREQAISDIMHNIGYFALDKATSTVLETLTNKLIAIPNATSAVSSGLTTFITATNTSKVIIPIPQDTTLQDGLVAHYEFEGNANDTSGNGNDGTEYGGVNYVDGVIGKAASFHNINNNSYFTKNDYIILKKVSLGTEFTISHFVKFNSNAHIHSGATYSIGDASNGNHIIFAINIDGIMNMDLKGINDSLEVINLSDKEWHLISLTINNNKAKLFKDGILQSESNVTEKINYQNLEQYVSFHSWYNGSGGSSRFNGLIDDLRIYNRALSESEIEELYNLGK